jgi:hypothetical protein
MQNNRYRSSQNPHLTHEAPLHPMKVGVWCVVNARRIAVPVFFNKIINSERWLCVEGSAVRHTDSLAEFVCASQLAVHWSP